MFNDGEMLEAIDVPNRIVGATMAECGEKMRNELADATVRAAADELGALLSVKEHGEARAGASLAPLCPLTTPRLTRRC